MVFGRNVTQMKEALGLITLAAAAFFAPVWAGGGWLPYGGGDLASLLWPNYRFAARTLQAGALPLWTPHLFSGMPFWADNQSAVLYPPNLLVMLLTDVPYQALEALVMGHIWLAGLAMYACLRLIRREEPLPPPAAALGALAWMFSDVFVTHIGNLNLNAAAAWLPLIALGAWRSLADRRVGWAVLGGAAFGLSILAGHAQIAYMNGLLVAAIAGWQIGAALLRRAPREALAAVGLAALLVLVGAGISAAGWLPTLELTGQSGRASLSYEQAAAYSLPPRALTGALWPPAIGRGPAAFKGDWERVEVGYMGLVALGCALIGALRGILRRDGLAIFLLALAVTSLLLALGRYFPLHRLAYAVLPGFASLRVPARFVLISDFAGAALAAWAVGGLLKGGRWQAAAWALAVIGAGELIAQGAWVEVQYSDPRSGFGYPDTLAWLDAQPGAPTTPFRIDTVNPAVQPHLAQWHAGTLATIYGFSQPLSLAQYEQFYWSMGYRGSPMYDFLGAKYVIGSSEPPGDASFAPLLTTGDGVTLYLNTDALPLAQLVYEAESHTDSAGYWDALHAESWDPASLVFVEGGPALTGERPPDDWLSYVDYRPNRIELLAQTSTPAYLVLSEVYYPGWVATVNGVRTPIYRANLAFRAVALPDPGTQRIVLAFRPAGVYAGLAISGASTLALAGAGILYWRKRARG